MSSWRGVKPSTVSGCVGGPVVALLIHAAASNWGIDVGVELGRAVSIMTAYWRGYQFVE